MRGLIDCAVLWPANCCNTWLDAWVARSTAAESHLRLYRHELACDAHGQVSVESLRNAGLPLCSYDAALLPVDYGNLSWVRTALAVNRQSQPQHLPVLLLALVHDLQAAAIQDLLDLGVTDFVRDDADLGDVRVRATRLVTMRSSSYRNRAAAASATPTTPPDVSASPWSASVTTHETFGAAKRRVIANFERHYLIRILMRHAGNISMAARAAQKHRRAFWELLRKHQINAETYRNATFVETPPPFQAE